MIPRLAKFCQVEVWCSLPPASPHKCRPRHARFREKSAAYHVPLHLVLAHFQWKRSTGISTDPPPHAINFAIAVRMESFRRALQTRCWCHRFGRHCAERRPYPLSHRKYRQIQQGRQIASAAKLDVISAQNSFLRSNFHHGMYRCMPPTIILCGGIFRNWEVADPSLPTLSVK